MEAPEGYREGLGKPLPNKFRRGLDALAVDYPGCERDLVVAREAVELGAKKDFLKAFRILKGKQVAFEHYEEMRGTETWIADELEYPGNEADKRELQNWFHDHPPNAKNIRIFKERVEGLRNKNAAIRGDRSHPNITALLALQLTYPGCETDVQEALQVHYSRPRTVFPDVIHSIRAKQERHAGDRSHWRLVKLDNLELTYPNWKRDVEAAEDWHLHKAESPENDVLFHEIVEGMLEKEILYLEWCHVRRIPKPRHSSKPPLVDQVVAPSESRDDPNTNHSSEDPGKDDNVGETEGREKASVDRYYLVGREERTQDLANQLRHNESLLDSYSDSDSDSYSSSDDEEREPELDDERY